MYYFVLCIFLIQTKANILLGMTCKFKPNIPPQQCFNITECYEMMLNTLNNSDIVFFMFDQTGLCDIKNNYPIELIIFGITYYPYNFANGSIYHCENFAQCMKIGCHIYSKGDINAIGIIKKAK